MDHMMRVAQQCDITHQFVHFGGVQVVADAFNFKGFPHTPMAGAGTTATAKGDFSASACNTPLSSICERPSVPVLEQQPTKTRERLGLGLGLGLRVKG